MLQHAQKHKIGTVGVPRLSTGLDKLNWLKDIELIMIVFHKSVITVMVYTQPEQQQQTVSLSRTKSETERKTEIQQAQEDNQSLSTVLS